MPVKMITSIEYFGMHISASFSKPYGEDFKRMMFYNTSIAAETSENECL